MNGQEPSMPNSSFSFTPAHERHHYGLPYLAIGALLAVASMIYTSLAAVPTFSGGGPQNGQNGVPLEALIDVNASEELSAGTVTTSNVFLISCANSTDASACAGPVQSNLCTSVTLGNGPNGNNSRITCEHNPLTINTTYQFGVSTAVRSQSTNEGGAACQGCNAGNAYISIFRTGAVDAMNNTTAPRVVNTLPSPGQVVPANGNLFVEFSRGPEGNMSFGANPPTTQGQLNHCSGGNCAVSIKKIVNFAPADEVCTDSTTCVFTWSEPLRLLKVNPATNLTAGSEYDLCVRGGQNALAVRNGSSQGLAQDHCVRFSVSAAETAVPTVQSISPTNNETVSRFNNLYRINFSEDIDPTTVGGVGGIRFFNDVNANGLFDQGTDTALTDSNVAAEYRPAEKAMVFGLVTALTAGQRYCFRVQNGVTDLAGNAFADVVPGCFLAAADTDTTGARVDFCDADNFKVVCRFTEPVAKAAAETAGNYSLECPTGAPVSLSTATLTYNPLPGVHEVTIAGVGLTPGQNCKFTVTGTSNITDLAGNAFSTTGGR